MLNRLVLIITLCIFCIGIILIAYNWKKREPFQCQGTLNDSVYSSEITKPIINQKQLSNYYNAKYTSLLFSKKRCESDEPLKKTPVSTIISSDDKDINPPPQKCLNDCANYCKKIYPSSNTFSIGECKRKSIPTDVLNSGDDEKDLLTCQCECVPEKSCKPGTGSETDWNIYNINDNALLTHQPITSLSTTLIGNKIKCPTIDNEPTKVKSSPLNLNDVVLINNSENDEYYNISKINNDNTIDLVSKSEFIQSDFSRKNITHKNVPISNVTKIPTSESIEACAQHCKNTDKNCSYISMHCTNDSCNCFCSKDECSSTVSSPKFSTYKIDNLAHQNLKLKDYMNGCVPDTLANSKSTIYPREECQRDRSCISACDSNSNPYLKSLCQNPQKLQEIINNTPKVRTFSSPNTECPAPSSKKISKKKCPIENPYSVSFPCNQYANKNSCNNDYFKRCIWESGKCKIKEETKCDTYKQYQTIDDIIKPCENNTDPSSCTKNEDCIWFSEQQKCFKRKNPITPSWNLVENNTQIEPIPFYKSSPDFENKFDNWLKNNF